MFLRFWLALPLAILAIVHSTSNSMALAIADDKLTALDGDWLYVEDRTEGRAVEMQGPPMSVKFALRVEADAVVWPRPRGDERITLDSSTIEKDNGNGSITRYRGKWKEGVLEYTLETVRTSDDERVLLIRREFRVTDEGLVLTAAVNDGEPSVALYKHPEDIALPEPADAKISAVAWLADVWVAKGDTTTIEERWSPPLGGAMLGLSRRIKGEKMVGFEFLRIVERDGGLVYVAQPGGNPPTEFILTKLDRDRAEFVNPRHDYPQRIVYELASEEVMTASIGFANGGRLRGTEFRREAK